MTIAFATSACFSQSSSKEQNTEKIQIGPEVKAELVYFFIKEVSPTEVNEFQRTVTGIPSENGTGYSSLPGVMSEVMFYKGDFRGEAIRFKPNATDEEKALVKERILGSPLILKVYENVVPNEIDDLPDADDANEKERYESPNKIPTRKPSKVIITKDS